MNENVWFFQVLSFGICREIDLFSLIDEMSLQKNNNFGGWVVPVKINFIPIATGL